MSDLGLQKMTDAQILRELNKEYFGRYKREPLSFNRFSIKLFNDKITMTHYRAHEVRYKYFDDFHKVDKTTGELIKWCWADVKKAQKWLKNSVFRTRRTIKELSDKNIFDYFVTISFRKEYVDRYSAEVVHKAFKNVMKRLKYKYGGVSYLAVAEFHKDKAIHYHCLMNFELEPNTYCSQKKGNRKNKILWFMDKFKKEDCFLAAKKIENGNPINYLLKYITKDSDKPLARRFSCSRDLERSRLVTSVSLTNSFADPIMRIANKKGFQLWNSNDFCKTYVFQNAKDGRSGGARSAPRSARPDLFKAYIKDEKSLDLLKLFVSLLHEYGNDKSLRQGKNANYTVNGKNVEVGGKDQLSFVL